MGVFDNLTKAVTDAGNKTKDISETMRINSMISQNTNKIKNLYTKIGENYWNLHKDAPEEALADLVAEINQLEITNMEHKKKIELLKGVKICKACGAEISSNSLFCNNCGAKVEKESPVVDNVPTGKTCTRCGAVLADDVNFCTSCGAPVSKQNLVVEEPVVEEPVVEEPVVEEPVVEEPVIDEPVMESPEEIVFKFDDTPAEPIVLDVPEIKESPVKKCNNCGAILEDGLRFCTSCGTKVSSDDKLVVEDDTIEMEPIVDEIATKRCSVCGTQLAADMLFCTNCGHKLDENESKQKKEVVRFCVNCGHKLDADAIFCDECGHKVE